MRTKVGIPFQLLLVAPINEDCLTSSVKSTIYISPPISDDETRCKVNFESFGCPKQHPWPRFSAIARVSVLRTSMETGHHAVNRQLFQKPFMNGFDGLAGERAATDIRLVRRNHQEKSKLFESLTRLGYTRQQFEFVQAARRIGLTCTNEGAVDDAVAVEKDSAYQRIGIQGRSEFGVWRSEFGVHRLKVRGSEFGVRSSR